MSDGVRGASPHESSDPGVQVYMKGVRSSRTFRIVVCSASFCVHLLAAVANLDSPGPSIFLVALRSFLPNSSQPLASECRLQLHARCMYIITSSSARIFRASGLVGKKLVDLKVGV